MKKFVIVILVGVLSASAFSIEPPVNAIAEKVDSLFVIASSGMIKYRDMVAPAIDSLAAMGAPATPRLLDHYDTKSARERHTINNILVKIGSSAVPEMLKTLRATLGEKKGRICYSLGNIKDSSAVDDLIKSTEDDDWRVRSSAAGALGKIGDKKAESSLLVLLIDTVETVRKSSAVAIGQIESEESIPILVNMLGDSFYGPRHIASEVLVKFGESSIQFLADSLDSNNEVLGDMVCATLGKIGGERAAFTVAPQLLSENITRRAIAVEAILNSGSSLACGFVELLAETEQSPIVLHYINKVVQRYDER